MHIHTILLRRKKPCLRQKILVFSLLLIGCMEALLPLLKVSASSFDPTDFVNTEAFMVIDDTDSTSDVVVKFGDTLAKTITYNRTTTRFEFSDAVSVAGNLRVAGNFSGATLNVNNLQNCDTIDTDANGRMTCGTDTGGASGLSQSDGDARYVNTAGDTMTGSLKVRGNLSGTTLRIDKNADIWGSLSATGAIRTKTGAILNADNDTNDAVLIFGNATLAQTLKYSNANQRFEFSKDVRVTGSVTAVGALSGTTLTVSGTAGNTFVLDGNSVVFDATNNRIGIGTSAPDTTLEVVGTTSGRLIHAQNRLESSGSLVVRSNQSQPVLVTSGATVGIGKAYPKSKLEVVGTISGSALTISTLKNCSILGTSSGGVVSCGGMVIKRKPANQVVNNSTLLVHDPTQSFQLAANDTWVFRFSNLVRSATASQAMSFAVAAPSGAKCVYGAVDLDSASTGTGGRLCNYMVRTTASASAARIAVVEVNGMIINGANAGSGYLRWAQWTAAANATEVLSGSTLIAFKPVGSDIAEVYRTRVADLIPGSVVSVDPTLPSGVIRSRGGYDETMLGVISTKPGMLIGGDDLLDGKGGVPVFLALAGRVPVMVTMENGPIKPGDYLTSSSTPGLAMRATRAGPVIGKALTGFSGPGDGVVTVFVQNSLLPTSLTETPVRDIAENPSENGDAVSPYVLPAGSLTPGRTARITARGTYSTGTSPGNLSLEILLGSTPLCQTRENAYVTNIRDRSWTVDCTFTVRKSGLLGEIDAQGLAILSTTRTEAQTIGLENLQTIRVNTLKANSLHFRSNTNPPQKVLLRQMVVQFLN